MPVHVLTFSMRLPCAAQAGQALVSLNPLCRVSSPHNTAMPKRRRPSVTAQAEPKEGSSNTSAKGTQHLSAVGAPQMLDNKGRGCFRFWHDERRFKNPGSACVVQEALFAAGGVRTGGYPKASPVPGPLGFQRPGDWDMLWSPARLALRAVPSLKPGQLISSSPGMMSLTRKRKLPVTLRGALDDAAWAITPESFVLPDELGALQAHMASREAAGRGDELWILKTAQHLGKGLKLLPAREICAEATNRHICTEGSRRASKPYVLAQRYVDDPLLVEGRKFGIRVWVLVLGPNPMRAYLHTNGLVLFATHGYDTDAWRAENGGVGLGHVTNYAQNVDGTVWDLDQLKAHLGDDAFNQLWSNISHSAALMCSSALSHMRAEHAALHVPAESAFELLGLDYLVDTSLHPWLLEVNGTPSLAVDHSQPQVERLIHTQKAGMVRDMFNLLGVSTRFSARYEAIRLAAKHAATVRSPAPRVLGPTRPVTNSKASRDGSDAEEDEEEDGADEEDNNTGAAAGAGGMQTGGNASAKNSLLGIRVGGKALTVPVEGPVFVLPRRIRDQLAPKSESAIRARVEQELQHRGAFEPLMTLFPMSLNLLTPAPPSTPARDTQSLDSEINRTSPTGASSTTTSVDGQGGEHGQQAEAQGLGSKGTAEHGSKTHGRMAQAVMEALRVAHVPWSVQDLALRRTLDALNMSKAGHGQG